MNPPYQTPNSSHAHEMRGNVMPFDPNERGQQYVERYESIVASFKNLFELCREPNASPNLSQCSLDIILGTTTTDEQSHLAIVRPIVSFGYPGEWATFQEADGFDVREYEYVPEEQNYNLLQATSTYSLGHRGCGDNNQLYTNGQWTPDRVAKIAEWLQDHLPQSRIMLHTLFRAASNPTLNPELSKNITAHEQIPLVVRLTDDAVDFFDSGNASN